VTSQIQFKINLLVCKNQEATSRSGKKRNCFVATIVVQNFLRRFTDASAYRATIHNCFFSIPHFSVASENSR
jgi:hypothetical protein